MALNKIKLSFLSSGGQDSVVQPVLRCQINTNIRKIRTPVKQQILMIPAGFERQKLRTSVKARRKFVQAIRLSQTTTFMWYCEVVHLLRDAKLRPRASAMRICESGMQSMMASNMSYRVSERVFRSEKS